MDATFVNLIADAGTVAILVFLLIQVLAAYKTANERTADLLENMIDDLNPDKPEK